MDGAATAPRPPSGQFPKSASVAKEVGSKFYFTGKPCKYGHVNLRYASTLVCVDCQIANNAEWKLRNPDYHRLKKAEWRAGNPGEHARKARMYRASNLEKVRLTEKLHRQRFPEIRRVKDANRRARKKGASDTYTALDIDRILVAQGFRCACCQVSVRRRDRRHIDHIVPLAKGGSNAPKNIQVLCVSCNLSKSDKLPEEFMRARGYLI